MGRTTVPSGVARRVRVGARTTDERLPPRQAIERLVWVDGSGGTEIAATQPFAVHPPMLPHRTPGSGLPGDRADRRPGLSPFSMLRRVSRVPSGRFGTPRDGGAAIAAVGPPAQTPHQAYGTVTDGGDHGGYCSRPGLRSAFSARKRRRLLPSRPLSAKPRQSPAPSISRHLTGSPSRPRHSAAGEETVPPARVRLPPSPTAGSPPSPGPTARTSSKGSGDAQSAPQPARRQCRD